MSARRRSLRDRVRSYLGAYGSSPKTNALLDDIASLTVIVTDSVVEALALENNLIKQRSPRYNILLRDDKNYPYLQLTTGEAFPRVLVARAVERDGALLRGPVPARQAGPAHHGADAQAVRHPLLQRGDHRRARAAVPGVRHQALPGAVRAVAVHARTLRAGGGGHPPVPGRPERRAVGPPRSADGGCRAARTVRGGCRAP